jgi:hypothetical protein
LFGPLLGSTLAVIVFNFLSGAAESTGGNDEDAEEESEEVAESAA